MKAIRAKRRRLMRAVEQRTGPLEPLRHSVRRHPAAWALGSVLVGAVVVRSFGGQLVRGGRRMAGTWMRGRVGAALLGAALKAYDIVRSEFEPPPRPSAAARADGPARDASAAAPSAAPASESDAKPHSTRPAAAVERQDPQGFSRP